MNENITVEEFDWTKIFLRSKELALLSVLCFRESIEGITERSSMAKNVIVEILAKTDSIRSTYDLLEDCKKNMASMFEKFDCEGGYRFLLSFYETGRQTMRVRGKDGELYGLSLVVIPLVIHNEGTQVPADVVANARLNKRSAESLINQTFLGGKGACIQILDGIYSFADIESIRFQGFDEIFKDFVSSMLSPPRQYIEYTHNTDTLCMLSGGPRLSHLLGVLLTQGDSVNDIGRNQSQLSQNDANQWSSCFGSLVAESICSSLKIQAFAPSMFFGAVSTSFSIKKDIDLERSLMSQLNLLGVHAKSTRFQVVRNPSSKSAYVCLSDSFGAVLAGELYAFVDGAPLSDQVEKIERLVLSFGAQKTLSVSLPSPSMAMQ